MGRSETLFGYPALVSTRFWRAGPLDDIVQYNGTFATLGTDEFANEARTGGFNSSMMVWTSSEHKEASGEQSKAGDYCKASSCYLGLTPVKV